MSSDERSATWVRDHFSEVLDDVRATPVTITRNGRQAAVLVSLEFFTRAIEALEDAEDEAAVRAHLAAPVPQPTTPLDEVIQRLERVESELSRRAG